MSKNPAAVFHRGMELLLAKDMAGFIALFAEDAVLELPFAPPGQPRRVVGRADGRLVHYRDYWDPIAAQELLGGGLVRS
ncbi:nuclear transport factor 2 family protein [Micromonospora sp. DT15]|uniref:nuclear transport factor 2 family protein n=1 Tax=Micromonospora sp. DT15 TaxID=3393445 RepID=UPI003CE6D04E